jgi:hypothetical protein
MKPIFLKNVETFLKKCLEEEEKCWSWKMLTRKKCGNTSEKCRWEKMLANFRKMLTKNVGNTPKSVDEKIL